MPEKRRRRPPARRTAQRPRLGLCKWRAMEGQRSHPQPSGNAFTAGLAGWRSSAIAAKPGRACRSTQSADPRYADLETGSVTEVPVMPEWPVCPTGANDQADRTAGNHAVQVGPSGRGALVAVWPPGGGPAMGLQSTATTVLIRCCNSQSTSVGVAFGQSLPRSHCFAISYICCQVS